MKVAGAKIKPMDKLSRRKFLTAVAAATAAIALGKEGTKVPPRFAPYESRIAEVEKKISIILRAHLLPSSGPYLKEAIKHVPPLKELFEDSLKEHSQYETQLKAALKLGEKGVPVPPEEQEYARKRLPEIRKRRKELEDLLGVWTPVSLLYEFSPSFWVAVIADEAGERGIREMLDTANALGGHFPPLGVEAASTKARVRFSGISAKDKRIASPYLKRYTFKDPLRGEEEERLVLEPPKGMYPPDLLPMVRVHRLKEEGPTTRDLRKRGLLKTGEPLDGDNPAAIVYPEVYPAPGGLEANLVILEGALYPTFRPVRFQRVRYNETFLKQWLLSFMG